MISGDNNVVVQIDQRPVAEVAVPDTVAALERVLFGPVVGPDLSLVGSWLRPDAGIVEAEPRPEVDTLVGWCVSGRGPVVRLVCGAGGQGKTHLARQVCQKLRDQGWMAGSVVLPSPGWRTVTQADAARGGTVGARARRDLQRVAELTAGVRAAAKLQVRTLLVVDYAENVGPVVAELLDTIAEADASKWVRVLMLARTDRDWFQELAVEHHRHDWVHPHPMSLGALSQGWDADRVRAVWRRAVERFAQQARRHGFDVPAGVERMPVPLEEFTTTLDLYARALVSVLDAADGQGVVGDPGDRDALVGVLRHEQRQVSAALRAAGLHLNEVGQAWALAAVTLTIPFTDAEAVDVVGRLPGLTGTPWSVRARLARVLCGLYPDESRQRVWQAPRPDRLADVHLLELASRASSLPQWIEDLARLCGSDDSEAAAHAASVLRRCMSTPDPDGLWQDGVELVRNGLSELVDRFPAGFVPALVVVNPVGFEAQLVAAVEGRDGEGLSIEQVREVDGLLHQLGFSTTRTKVAVAVSHRLVAATQPDANRDNTAAGRYAHELTKLSVRLAEAGLLPDAASVSEEAVTIYRRLAADDATYRPNLATSLNSLSDRLAETGRHQDGVTASEEATTICRWLAAENPATYLRHLAESLNNLSVRLSGVGRCQEGLVASEEATTVYRRLAEDNPDAYLPGLAMSLSNLSNRLAETGRYQEGLAAGEEATNIYRRLAGINPDAYLPYLGASLINVSNLLTEVNRLQEGLAAIEQAVDIYRQLFNDNPISYRPNLAMSLNNLSYLLAETGRRQEGILTAKEAVDIFRQLAEDNPGAYLPQLGVSLNNLSIQLAKAGRRHEGLAVIEEAILVHHQLAKNAPAAYLPTLTLLLSGMKDLLLQGARTGEADSTADRGDRSGWEQAPDPRHGTGTPYSR